MEKSGKVAPATRCQSGVKHLGGDRRKSLALAEIERCAQIPLDRLRRAIAEEVAIALGAMDQVFEFGLRALLRQKRIGAAKVFGIVLSLSQRLLAGAFEQFGLRLIVDHFETGRDIGLKRKEMQQPFAKGMDRLDFETARRLHRLGEKPPREDELFLARRRRSDVDDRCSEGVIIEFRPFRQSCEDAAGHIGSRRLGEGEAKDFRRRHAGKQMAHDALRQHMGLAGAGIGRNPHRNIGIGGPVLLGANMRADLAELAQPSSPSSDPADHSLTRARWS